MSGANTIILENWTDCLCHALLLVVLITASGLQGEQPLVIGCMQVREVGKLDP